jgi:ubiquitin C-terminal hydrolase
LIKHVGSGNSGHYTSICKKYVKKMNKSIWVEFDDETTTIIDDDDIKNSIDNIYILFYRKKVLSPSLKMKLNLI